MPTGSGRDDVGEAEPDPVDDGGAAVGAHHQQAALRRRSVLRATSCSTGTLSLKTITSLPASRASIASTAALGAGHGHQDDRTRRRGSSAAAGGARRRLRGRSGDRAAAVGEGPVDLGADAVEAVGVVEPDRHDQVVDRGVGGDREAHPLEDLDVERRRHRDLGGHARRAAAAPAG